VQAVVSGSAEFAVVRAGVLEQCLCSTSCGLRGPADASLLSVVGDLRVNAATQQAASVRPYPNNVLVATASGTPVAQLGQSVRRTLLC
jgi:hypothetical protein